MSETAFPLSAETSNLKRSVMRDLLCHAVDPEIISMAGGLPASEYLPVGEFLDCIETVINRDGSRALQYSPQSEALRVWIAGYMSGRGVPCTPGQIFITSGAQQGLAILSRLFLDPGGPAVIEDLAFTGIQQVTRGRGAEIRTIPVDLEEGIDLEAMEDALRRSPTPRLAVLVPNFHNPLGVTLSAEARRRAAALASEYGVPLIEDDPYAALRFSGEHLPPIKAFDDSGLVFHIGTFSKTLSPAVRLGWIVASEEMIPTITAVRESIDLESSTLLQRAVVEFLERGRLEPNLERINDAYRERCRAMVGSLEANMGELARFTRPEGGIFLWVELQEQLDTGELFDEAIERRVAFIPGSVFSGNDSHRNTMRLNFSNLSPELIEEGVKRLSDVISSAPGIR
jgi:2-aminoadipate transaminase